MKLTSSLKTLKYKTLLLPQSTKSDTVTSKSIASVSSSQLCLLDQQELVNQFTFKTYFYTHSLVRSTWLLRSVSQPKLIATKSKILLTWSSIRLEQVSLDLVLEWNVSSSLTILICRRRKSSVPSHPLKFLDNSWLKEAGMTIKTKSILSESCKIP